MLGLATGYLTGFSRAPAVGAVLPAVLSLMAGLGAFIIGKHSEGRVIVSLCILTFSLSLVLATGWGAAMRQTAEDSTSGLGVQERQALDEVELRDFREALGLPPESRMKQTGSQGNNSTQKVEALPTS